MHKPTLAAVIAAGVLAASNAAIVHAQQSPSNTQNGRPGVLSATPIHSDAMVALERSGQRLRETIQTLAQEPPGARRDRAMNAARRALYETQQAMIQLPPEYRVSGVVVSNVAVKNTEAPRNRSFGDSVKDLQLAADRLRDSIHVMAQEPAGARRNDAIRAADKALAQTQEAMAWVPGYPATASADTRTMTGAAGAQTAAQGTLSNASGFGSVSGGTIRAGSDATHVQAQIPAVGGGVGLNARAMLSSEAQPEHNVKMVFALDTGNYVADVGVKVKDANGRTVIDGVSDGPWLYAKLPPGNYTATATYNGRSVTKHFSAGRSGQQLAQFRWPASVEHTASANVSPLLGTGPEERR
jgi:hypothetical protein